MFRGQHTDFQPPPAALSLACREELSRGVPFGRLTASGNPPAYNLHGFRRRNGWSNLFFSFPCSSRWIMQARMQPRAPSRARP